MRFIAIIFLLFITKYSYSQKDTLYLKGELQYDVIQNVDCGVAIIAVTGKIRIEEYSDLTYRKKQIVIIFICPKETGYDQLIEGKTYNFILTNNKATPYGGQIENLMTLEEFEIMKEFNDGVVVWAIEWEKVKM